MTKRAVLYARISGDDRTYMTSGIEAQLADCRQYAAKNGYEIVGEYFEDANKLTSGVEWLPEIEKIMEIAGLDVFDVLIVRELDRLSRDRFKHLLIQQHLHEYGIKIEYVIGQFAETDEGEFQEGVMREFAHYQRKQLTRKLHKGIRDHVLKGNIKTGGCASPYGYDLIKEDNRTILAINNFEANIVRLIFDLYVNKGFSIYKVTCYLDEHNIPKPMKGKAHKANVLEERKLGWSRGTVGGILTNEVYVGRWYYRKTKRVKNPKSKKTKHVPRPKEDWIMVSVPPVISEELFFAAESRRKRNKRTLGKQHRNNYAVGGMVKCGRCGKSVSGITHKQKKGDSQYSYSYYACNARLRSKTYGYKCDTPFVKAGEVDLIIWQWIKSILLDPKKMLAELEKFQESQLEEKRPFLKIIESNESILAALNEEKERLIKAYAAGVLSLDDIAVQKTELEKQINNTVQAIEELKAELDTTLLSQSQIDSIESYASEIREEIDLADNDPDIQRELYQLIDLQVTINQIEKSPVLDLQCYLGHSRLQPNDGTGYSFGHRLKIHARISLSNNREDTLPVLLFAKVLQDMNSEKVIEPC